MTAVDTAENDSKCALYNRLAVESAAQYPRLSGRPRGVKSGWNFRIFDEAVLDHHMDYLRYIFSTHFFRWKHMNIWRICEAAQAFASTGSNTRIYNQRHISKIMLFVLAGFFRNIASKIKILGSRP